jgi:hypothetical protein
MNAKISRDPDPELTEACTRQLRDLVAAEGFGAERVWVGAADQERADDIRRGLRRAAAHLRIACWAVYHLCDQGPDCADGHEFCKLAGDGACVWHVHFRAHRIEDARAFMREKAARLGWPDRGRGGRS